MFWFCATLSSAGVLESVICSFLVAEFAGYWLHRLLPGNRLHLLSRNHLAHYLLLYGPPNPMRWESYRYRNGASQGNADLETRPPRRVDRKGFEIAMLRYRLTSPLHSRSLGGERTGERKAAFQ
jgi:hypothetical protein